MSWWCNITNIVMNVFGLGWNLVYILEKNECRGIFNIIQKVSLKDINNCTGGIYYIYFWHQIIESQT